MRRYACSFPLFFSVHVIFKGAAPSGEMTIPFCCHLGDGHRRRSGGKTYLGRGRALPGPRPKNICLFFWCLRWGVYLCVCVSLCVRAWVSMNVWCVSCFIKHDTSVYDLQPGTDMTSSSFPSTFSSCPFLPTSVTRVIRIVVSHHHGPLPTLSRHRHRGLMACAASSPTTWVARASLFATERHEGVGAVSVL